MSDPGSARKRRADLLLGGAASAILLAMMLLTVVDVVARYVFSRPLRGAFEATELMLVILIFAGLPLVSFADEHAVMDFVDRFLGPGARGALRRTVQLSIAGQRTPGGRAGYACSRTGFPSRYRSDSSMA